MQNASGVLSNISRLFLILYSLDAFLLTPLVNHFMIAGGEIKYLILYLILTIRQPGQSVNSFPHTDR